MNPSAAPLTSNYQRDTVSRITTTMPESTDVAPRTGAKRVGS